MKNLKYIFYLLLILSMSACQKLDRDYVTDYTQAQIESSYAQVNAEINAIYLSLPDGMQAINGNAMLASASDEAEHTQETNPVQNFNTGNWNAINNPDNVWPTYFTAIRRANLFIVSTSKVNLDRYRLDPSANGQSVYKTDLAYLKQWTYEARFLRAFFNFELVKRYGGIPLLKTAISTDQAMTVPRNSLADCIQYISDECDSAANNLPIQSAVLSTDYGHATKGAALALKSRLLLYAASDLFNTTSWAGGFHPELISLSGDRIAKWAAAAKAAKAVIDLGGYALNSGGYNALFNNFNSSEIIFARRNAASNTFEKNNFPIGFSGQSGTTPSQDLVDAFENNDGTPFDWNNPAMAANPYANRDPRLYYNVIYNNAGLNSSFAGRNKVEIWNGGRDGQPITNATKTGYYLRKYIVESTNLTTGANPGVHSWIIFRLPEMYLNYAEALNESDPGNPDIKKYVDLVRTRAVVQPTPSIPSLNPANPALKQMPPLPVGLSQAQMRDRIRNEERVEFAFEEHRIWDVRRWMIAPATLGAPLRGVNITQTAPNTFSYAPFQVENRVFQTKMYLYPIPQGDIISDQNLIQNPQW